MKRILLVIISIISTNYLFSQDGTLDISFNAVNRASTPNFFAIQNDGKILADESPRIIRLNSNGSIDNSFNVGTGVNYKINSILIQNDGKILVGGSFNSFNGVPKNDLVRLNVDGSIDATFNSGEGVDSQIFTIALQSDGKILLGGNFTTYNNVSKNGIVRLNQDGSLDNSFVGIGVDQQRAVDVIKIQSDNKIIIGGSFNFYNNTAVQNLARINNDGSIDNTFGSIGSYVSDIAIQTDGKVLVSYFDSATNNSKIIRINSNGTLDTSFNVGTQANGFITSILIQQDGKIILSGSFTSFNNTARNHITRLNTNGSNDLTFNPGTGTNGIIYISKIQQDSKIMIGGQFSNYNGITRNGIARLNNAVLSVSENLKDDLKIYPNPVGNVLKIETKKQIKNGEIFSISGQKLKEFSSKEVNVSEFTKGTYIIKLNIDNKAFTQKFIKE